MGLIKPDLGKVVWFAAGVFLSGYIMKYIPIPKLGR